MRKYKAFAKILPWEGKDPRWEELSLSAEVQKQQATMAVASGSSEESVWIVDSGATQILIHNESQLQNTQPSTLGHVSKADGHNANVTCQGSVVFSALNYTFVNILSVPSLETNLFSICALDKVGFSVMYQNKSC